MSKHTPNKPRPKPKRALFAALATVFVALAACSTNMIAVEAIEDPTLKVSARHDAYVAADPDLLDLEREIYLRTTELLRRVIEEAKK